LALKRKTINNEPATTKNLESQNETISTTATTSTQVYNFIPIENPPYNQMVAL